MIIVLYKVSTCLKMLQRYKSKYFSLIASATTSCTINEREREEIKEITASQNKYRV